MVIVIGERNGDNLVALEEKEDEERKIECDGEKEEKRKEKNSVHIENKKTKKRIQIRVLPF